MNQSKKPTIYDFLFTIAVYSLQNIYEHTSEMKNKQQNSLLQQAQFFSVWRLFCMQAKSYDLPPCFSKN